MRARNGIRPNTEHGCYFDNRGLLMRLVKMPAAAVADAEHVHHVVVDGEQDTVDMRLAAVKQLPHVKGNGSAFGGKRAAPRHVRERVDGFPQSEKPAQPGFTGML